MIVRFKIFEGILQPTVGDWVVCREESQSNNSLINVFLSENIGKIVEITTEGTIYIVEYDFWSIPVEIYEDFFEDENKLQFFKREILYFTSDKKECEEKRELFMDTNKYNI